MKAGWIFCKNENGNPKLPDGVSGNKTVHLDIYRATGGSAGQEHTHFLAGAKGEPSEELSGDTYEHHYHYFPFYDGQYRQITIGAPDHTHTATLVNGTIVPDWFLVFWIGSDADAALIAEDPECAIAAQAVPEENEDGEMVFGGLDKTSWTPSERAQWESRITNVLGLYLPEEVTNGDRLIAHFIGILMSRSNQLEMNLRGLPMVIE